jgi:hypothetical protein
VGLGAKAVLMWIVLLVAMFCNGTLRVLVLQPFLGEDMARQWASLSGVCVIGVLSFFFVRACPDARQRQLLGVGATWLVLTLAFEFLFGHFVSGASWAALLADYDVRRGRLWILVLVATFLAPWVWGTLRDAK